MFLQGCKNTKRAFDLFTHQFPCCCCDCLEIKMQHIESTQTCKNEQKKQQLTFWFFVFTSHSECSAVVLFSRSTCDLSLAAWPVGQTPQGQFIGRQKAEVTQLTGRGPPTRNQPSFPHTHIRPPSHLCGLRPSLCLSPLNSGNVRFVITDLWRVHAVGSHACHYAVWRFLSPCSSLSRPRKSEDWFPVGSCVCVCSVGEHAFLKLNPELTAVLFLSC